MTCPIRRRRIAGLLLALLALWWLPAHDAHAGIYCSITNTPMSLAFGNVTVSGSSGASSTVQINYTCTSYSPAETFTLCATGPTGDNIGPYTSPQMKLSGGAWNAPLMQYNYYIDGAHTTAWTATQFVTNTSSTSMAASVNGAAVVASGVITVYAYIPGNQTTLTAGSYAETVYNINLGFVSGTQCLNSTGDLTSYKGASISASATLANACTVSANSTLNFGSFAAGTSETISGSNAIYVNCPSGTAYYVGLSPQNVASTTGLGTMKGATSGNASTIAYQLYSNSGLSTAWGNTATSTSVGNGVAGTGTGSAQTLTAYAKVTGSTNVTPDAYSDVVQVIVNY
ncbi:MAG: spore coat U domain-containing protein [Rudaea sp.]|uniref:Csu type fimbrial protein n=1 Tax=Rudaea sp. TaxID=2136325 RepID=UPI0039E30F24